VAEAPAGGFVPPPYPYDRLAPLKAAAEAHEGGIVDLSIGTPCDPPPPAVIEALASSGAERGYPPSIGTPVLRDEISAWLERRLAVTVDAGDVAACVGTKELVGLLPHLLRLRDPSRDTVLYPAISYPTYAMGATLAGCRAVPVPVDERWCLDLTAIEPADVERALCLWVNTPGNPAGGLDDLGAVATWGRANGVLVASDECYVEFTWVGEPVRPGLAPGRSILEHGTDGLLAVHSLSKRSNLAGLRVGFYAGQADLVHYLAEVRKHLGLMLPGPAQAAGAVALQDDEHVHLQRERYHDRLTVLADVLRARGSDVAMPDGAFYLWAPAPGGDAWAFARLLAEDLGMLVSPGELYGPAGADHVRVAAVQSDDRIEALAGRAGVI
jgi:succinyldiaminopimelate transaminase